jgi:SAM-dependent methyltransferase
MTTTFPYPPPELAGYVIGAEDLAGVLQNYETMGAHVRAVIEELLSPGWTWPGKVVLDFGCGSGRVLRQLLPSAEGAEFHGAELDTRCVEWLRDNLPVQVVQSHPDPPLPYPDAHFDLIYSTSVFSHLADTWAAWLLELRRLVRPGGLVIATVMGAGLSQEIADEPWDPDRIGMNVLGYGRPWNAGGPMVLHSEWWLRAHWGRAFTVERFRPGGDGGQDTLVLRRDERPAPTVEALLEPEPGEPRELTAALHCIRQLHREHATLNRQHDANAAAYREEAARREAAEAAVPASRLRRLLRR